MDNTRVFNSGTMDYIPSDVKGTSVLRRLYLILNHCVKFGLSPIVGCFSYFLKLCRCNWGPKCIAGHVVLVTGGANGIGRELCLKLAKEKCRIAIVDINLEAAEQTVEDIRQLGVEAKAYHADVTDYDAILKIRMKIQEDFQSSVDILINNVGLVPLLTLSRATKEQIERMMAVNVTSTMLITKLFMEDMVKQGRGHIVATSSAFSLAPGSTVDGVTAFAVRGFMANLRQEILINNWEDMIKTTTTYPYYTTTRKELTDYLEKIKVLKEMFLADVTNVANSTVKAIKWEKENLTIPNGFYLLMIFMGNFPSTVTRRFYRMAFGRSSNFP
ncbi:hypothetical protein DMENIID0001_127170 [Sergentomyia squamirostris]